MDRLSKNQAGFTFIEMMIVLAIISILAAIAIPQYRNQQTKAFDAHIHTMLSAMSLQTIDYLASTDTLPIHLGNLGYTFNDFVDLGGGLQPVFYIKSGKAEFYYYGFRVPDPVACGTPSACFAVIAADFQNGDGGFIGTHRVFSMVVNANNHSPEVTYGVYTLADL